MTEELLLARITSDPTVMAGKPVIRGTRLTVDYILGLLAHGESVDGILAEYQRVTAEDIQACLAFARKTVAESSFVPLRPTGT